MGNKQGSINAASAGGVSGTHPAASPFQIFAGSSTTDEFNTVVLQLIPVGCWKVDDVRFVFDSSFVLPDVRDELALLNMLIVGHTTRVEGKPDDPPTLSIFGHADPVGSDDYNKYLSGRRAAAIYGMLTRRAEVWEDLYSDTGHFAQPVQGDKWGLASIQTMLTELGFPASVDGQMGPETKGALQDFQGQNGLPSSGNADSATRNKLYLAYMDKLCLDENGKPYKIDPVSGFLAQNADPGGKGDFQGCGEFNPMLIFSQQEEQLYSDPAQKDARDDANQINRRVVGMLFRPGSKVLPDKWACPRAKEDTKGCRKRFWVAGQSGESGETRRSKHLPDVERKFEDNQDTFACRFYQRRTEGSPCEQHVQVVPIMLRLIDDLDQPMKQARYRLDAGTLNFEGVTGDDGLVKQFILADSVSGKLTLLDKACHVTDGGSETPWSIDLEFVQLEAADTVIGFKTRLNNLGFFAGTDADANFDIQTRRAVQRFQTFYEVFPTESIAVVDKVTSTLDADTIRKLGDVYVGNASAPQPTQ